MGELKNTSKMKQKSTVLLLEKLRKLMVDSSHVTSPLQAYFIPMADRHQNEYLADNDKRVAFISGFNGSEGTAIVTQKEAALWTDGRYFLQASEELDENWTLMKMGELNTPTEGTWLNRVLPSGSLVGADPELVSNNIWRILQSQLETHGNSLVPIETNLVDLIWGSKPVGSVKQLIPLPMTFSGKLSSEKLADVRTEMTAKGSSLLVLTALDEIAWLLNVRGSDIKYNPVFFAYCVVTLENVFLFIDEAKLSEDVLNHFSWEGVSVSVKPYNGLRAFLTEQIPLQKGYVWMGQNACYGLTSIVPEKKRIIEITPICVMKSVKNSTEVKGMINAHIKDAAAMCCYLTWLEQQLDQGNKVTEISGANKLEQYRSEQQEFMGLSFETISSVGSNGAIIHYAPSPATDRPITKDELYLFDSGGHYKDGTTDVTRTVHFGNPTAYEKECFTRVFKGQHFVASCKFPVKVKGNYLDTLARKYLWDVGLNYMHGTGHGVGAFLNVHEGPIGMSWRPYPDDPGLQEGMFLSNEPGYYEDGKFGIRIEDIVRVIPVETKYKFGNHQFLGFETVSLVPIQTKMLDTTLLTEDEVAYLNKHHARCLEKVGPLLKRSGHEDAYQWLERETKPIVVCK